MDPASALRAPPAAAPIPKRPRIEFVAQTTPSPRLERSPSSTPPSAQQQQQPSFTLTPIPIVIDLDDGYPPHASSTSHQTSHGQNAPQPALHMPSPSAPGETQLRANQTSAHTDKQQRHPTTREAQAPAHASPTEVVLLDDDDLLPEGPSTLHTQLTPAKPPAAQTEVIDLDDDESLANLQPLPPQPTRLHVSRGGGLFRVQPTGSLEIVDSDDEQELLNSNALVNAEDGLHALAPDAQRLPPQNRMRHPRGAPRISPSALQAQTYTAPSMTAVTSSPAASSVPAAHTLPAVGASRTPNSAPSADPVPSASETALASDFPTSSMSGGTPSLPPPVSAGVSVPPVVSGPAPSFSQKQMKPITSWPQPPASLPTLGGLPLPAFSSANQHLQSGFLSAAVPATTSAPSSGPLNADEDSFLHLQQYDTDPSTLSRENVAYPSPANRAGLARADMVYANVGTQSMLGSSSGSTAIKPYQHASESINSELSQPQDGGSFQAVPTATQSEVDLLFHPPILSGVTAAPNGRADAEARVALAHAQRQCAVGQAQASAAHMVRKFSNPSCASFPPTMVSYPKHFASSADPTLSRSIHTGDQEGISAEGLRVLVKQNGLTADATKEADTPPELNVQLMPHQRRALEWMSKREQPIDMDEDVVATDDECLGGILADDQGLGKTLTMIALLLKNSPNQTRRDSAVRNGNASSDGSVDLEQSSEGEEDNPVSADEDFVEPDPGDKEPWRTLVVCPLSLINQWKEELLSRIKEEFHPTVCVYHGPKRERRKSVLENCDVVITTYSTLVTEYPKILKDHPEYDMRKKEKLPLPKRRKGPLCQVEWRRVVLDESQYVKNRGTDSWSAVMSLKAEKRWCLTGTPIQNSVDDIFSLFCFIRYKFVPNVETWNTRWKKKLEHHLATVRERAFKKFQTIVGVVLLRRTKKDTIKGVPLITLPERKTALMEINFSDEEEMAVYKAVQEKSVLTVNKFLVEGTLANNYSSVLLVLLRLRQACSHPFLIQYAAMHGKSRVRVASDNFVTLYPQEELEEAMELVEGGHSLVSMIDDAAKERVTQALMPPEKGKLISSRFACSYCRTEASWKEGSFLACGDLFCRDCCQLVRQGGKCLKCLSHVGDPNLVEVFIGADEVRKEVHASAILTATPSSGVTLTAAEFKAWIQMELLSRKAGGSDTATPESTDAEVDDIDDDDAALRDLEMKIMERKAKDDLRMHTKNDTPRKEKHKRKLLDALSQHSTKIRAILDKLDEIRKQGSNEKTLIFSQWTSMLDIIEFHIQMEGHQFCRLDGSMTVAHRQKQIEEFKKNPAKNVFLISLHAGGTGLNLTAACHVILADVWWNPAAEEQAIDRVHRIGQTKDVHVIRFKIKDTVEERIYTICSRKREAADGTLGVTGAQSLGRKKLSMEELMYIFGGAARDVAQSAGRGSAAAEAANNILNYQQHGGVAF